MKVPLIGNIKMVKEDGYPTDEMKAWVSELQTNMNKSLSDEGLEIPQQSTTNINYINAQTQQNMMWYDHQTQEYKANVNGVVKTFTMS